MAALRAAEEVHLPYEGWVPLNFTNENGAQGIPERFRHALRESSTTASAERTEFNIRDSDGILTLAYQQEQDTGNAVSGHDLSKCSPGTWHGIVHARQLGKKDHQLFFVYLAKGGRPDHQQLNQTVDWLVDNKITKCAIGGPRESESPGIEKQAFLFLVDMLNEYKKRMN